jgi:hypothetical protein
MIEDDLKRKKSNDISKAKEKEKKCDSSRLFCSTQSLSNQFRFTQKISQTHSQGSRERANTAFAKARAKKAGAGSGPRQEGLVVQADSAQGLAGRVSSDKISLIYSANLGYYDNRGSEQDSFISTKAKGPNAGLRHGPNDDLLL